MHDIRADLDKNRIYITIGKLEDETEMKQIVAEVKSECRKLKRGFTCLTDLRNYEFQDERFEDYVRKAQKTLLDTGMSGVVRVRRKTGAIAHIQFDNVSSDLGYHAENVTSIEDGEKFLDQLKTDE